MAISQKMEEENVVIILKCLPHAYEHFIETLNITSTNVDLKFNETYAEVKIITNTLITCERTTT